MMMIVSLYHVTLTTSLTLSLLAFFFGFVFNEVTYDEARDEGLQELRYSPAPGNKTEKMFTFSLNFKWSCGVALYLVVSLKQ